ncbi:hypothetical protein PROFUN_10169 [Planoprotostelium fungivorum]|uniref:Uncharacterized protein n=1 Tax=Planoprotostelium fungivorum TaxID=1890364 RepID=A0A2P6NEK5_9EUKA|nr:hypothetical protein PROFUN_10169 [Planoprotostelium fungivorum]
MRMRQLRRVMLVPGLASTALEIHHSPLPEWTHNCEELWISLGKVAQNQYDWRIPPSKLETRDAKLTKMMHLIEALKQRNNGRRVVLVAHSMGNKLVHYFLQWLKRQRGQEWIDAHIDSFFSVSAPWMGNCMSIRGMLSGVSFEMDNLGLHPARALRMCRGMGSLPWLLPLRTDLSPVTHLAYQWNSLELNRKNIKTPGDFHSRYYAFSSLKDLMTAECPDTWDVFEKTDPNFWGENVATEKEEEVEGLACMEKPPVKLVCIYGGQFTRVESDVAGKNLDTEMSYLFQRNHHTKAFSIDSDVKLERGVLYETSQTKQRFKIDGKIVKASGDKTVPYYSMAVLPAMWKEQDPEGVTIHEFEDQEHRDILNSPVLFNTLRDHLTIA